MLYRKDLKVGHVYEFVNDRFPNWLGFQVRVVPADIRGYTLLAVRLPFTGLPRDCEHIKLNKTFDFGDNDYWAPAKEYLPYKFGKWFKEHRPCACK